MGKIQARGKKQAWPGQAKEKAVLPPEQGARRAQPFLLSIYERERRAFLFPCFQKVRLEGEALPTKIYSDEEERLVALREVLRGQKVPRAASG